MGTGGRIREICRMGRTGLLVAGLVILGSWLNGQEVKRYEVVATIGMIGDVAREVAGDRATVVYIVGEGVDPHLYTPTRGDVVKFRRADIIFYNGLLLEGRMTDILKNMKSRGKPVHSIADAIREKGAYPILPADEAFDPHLWMDLTGWVEATRVIAEILSEFDPPHAGGYVANAENYINQLQALDAYTREAVASIPEGRRVLVTAHDAFGYFGRAYGIEVRGIQGISTDSEAGLRDIEGLVRFIVERDIPAVFVESSISDRNVHALIEGAAARGHTLTIGGELYSDAMGPSGSYRGTYIGMIDHNVTTLVRALGGEVAEGGFQGKLERSGL